jgi:hypothetical protein
MNYDTNLSFFKVTAFLMDKIQKSRLLLMFNTHRSLLIFYDLALSNHLTVHRIQVLRLQLLQLFRLHLPEDQP